MKQFASWFTHGVPGGSKLRQQIFQSKTGTAVLAAVDQFFEARFASAQSGSPEPLELEHEPIEDAAFICD